MNKILDFLDSPLGALLLVYLLPAILAAIVSPPRGSKADNFLRILLAWGFDARKFVVALSALLARKPPPPPMPPRGPSRVEGDLPPVELRQGLHEDDPPDGGRGRGGL